MKPGDRYHKWIEWSEEDAAYLGKCPDLMTGIHGDDPVKLYAELHEAVEDVISHFEAEGRPLPAPRIRLMEEHDAEPQGHGQQSLLEMFNEAAEDLTAEDLEERELLLGGLEGPSMRRGSG